MIATAGKGVDYLLRTRDARRPVERDAVDEATRILGLLHDLTRARITHGAIVSSAMRLSTTSDVLARQDESRETAHHQYQALDQFRVALEKVHDDDARGACAAYATLAASIATEAAGVPLLDADEALAYTRNAGSRREELDAARDVARAALGAAGRK